MERIQIKGNSNSQAYKAVLLAVNLADCMHFQYDGSQYELEFKSTAAERTYTDYISTFLASPEPILKHSGQKIKGKFGIIYYLSQLSPELKNWIPSQNFEGIREYLTWHNKKIKYVRSFYFTKQIFLRLIEPYFSSNMIQSIISDIKSIRGYCDFYKQCKSLHHSHANLTYYPNLKRWCGRLDIDLAKETTPQLRMEKAERSPQIMLYFDIRILQILLGDSIYKPYFMTKKESTDELKKLNYFKQMIERVDFALAKKMHKYESKHPNDDVGDMENPIHKELKELKGHQKFNEEYPYLSSFINKLDYASANEFFDIPETEKTNGYADMLFEAFIFPYDQDIANKYPLVRSWLERISLESAKAIVASDEDTPSTPDIPEEFLKYIEIQHLELETDIEILRKIKRKMNIQKGELVLNRINNTLKDHKYIAKTTKATVADFVCYSELSLLLMAQFNFSSYPYILEWFFRMEKAKSLRRTMKILECPIANIHLKGNFKFLNCGKEKTGLIKSVLVGCFENAIARPSSCRVFLESMLERYNANELLRILEDCSSKPLDFNRLQYLLLKKHEFEFSTFANNFVFPCEGNSNILRMLSYQFNVSIQFFDERTFTNIREYIHHSPSFVRIINYKHYNFGKFRKIGVCVEIDSTINTIYERSSFSNVLVEMMTHIGKKKLNLKEIIKLFTNCNDTNIKSNIEQIFDIKSVF